MGTLHVPAAIVLPLTPTPLPQGRGAKRLVPSPSGEGQAGKPALPPSLAVG